MRTLWAGFLIVVVVGLLGFAPGNLDVYFIDVGHGDAILVKYETTEWLIDTGYKQAWSKPSTSSDRRCSDLLGITVDLPLEYFVLSHADLDHYSALDWFLCPCQIQTLSSSFDREARKVLLNDDSQAAACWTTSVRMPWVDSLSSDSPVAFAESGLSWRVLHPSTDFAHGTASTNDKSLILLLTYGSVGFLFTGDVESLDADVLAEWRMPNILILKAPHHGSAHSATVDLAEQLKPDLIVMSTDDCVPDTAEDVAKLGIPYLATSTSGTIHLRTDGPSVWITTDKLQETSASWSLEAHE